MSTIAIIGGTGLTNLKNLEITRRLVVNTPYGKPSAALTIGKLDGHEIYFLPRHGYGHTIPPHMINYRANIWALKEQGVKSILAVGAVGGISQNMSPKQLAICDQVIDYTYERKHTFFEADLSHVTHIDFTEPYHAGLRQVLIKAGEKAGLKLIEKATYGAMQGPRLETAAEIRRLGNDGCDVVGMTGMPEASLAAELEIEYASLAVVANWAAGKAPGVISIAEIEANLSDAMGDVKNLLSTAVSLIN